MTKREKALMNLNGRTNNVYGQKVNKAVESGVGKDGNDGAILRKGLHNLEEIIKKIFPGVDLTSMEEFDSYYNSVEELKKDIKKEVKGK